jgi:hypothetical protein
MAAAAAAAEAMMMLEAKGQQHPSPIGTARRRWQCWNDKLIARGGEH